MMRRASLCVLLVAAAIAASGCASSSPGTQAAPVQVDLEVSPCKVDPKRIEIQWDPSDMKSNKILWKRARLGKNAEFAPATNQADPDLFEKLRGRFGFMSHGKKSGGFAHEPHWVDDGKGNVYFLFTYIVTDVETGLECDPEICIRKSGSGCSG